MTPSPFAARNAARLRTERRWRLAMIVANAAILAALALIAAGIGHAILATALTLPETLTQAATLKGM